MLHCTMCCDDLRSPAPNLTALGPGPTVYDTVVLARIISFLLVIEPFALPNFFTETNIDYEEI
jgi:hypothetical protein